MSAVTEFITFNVIQNFYKIILFLSKHESIKHNQKIGLKCILMYDIRTCMLHSRNK